MSEKWKKRLAELAKWLGPTLAFLGLGWGILTYLGELKLGLEVLLVKMSQMEKTVDELTRIHPRGGIKE